MNITPVIMAGGSGTRLWPLSRSLYPKQFLSLTGAQSMLADTVLRTQGLNCETAIFLCNEEHRFLVAEQLRAIGAQGTLMLEPVGRNTAPAIALAALEIRESLGDGVMLVMASDHVIDSRAEFQAQVMAAAELAGLGKLVTFGVVPAKPETGYGYIHRGAAINSRGFEVDKFVEKPDLPTAEAYLASGEYYWNSGMFVMQASDCLAELERFSPDILSAAKSAYEKRSFDLDFVRVDAESFSACPEDSIDYAVMERTEKAAVVPLEAGWSDLGSWASLWDVGTKDSHGNVHHGDVILEKTRNSLIHSSHRMIATLGLKDAVVVETKDAVLVADRSKVQDIKAVVNRLKSGNRTEHQHHREVYRPWGGYDSVDNGERYQVKRITVKPGAKLSLQMHHHRAEHWVVVSGTAKVTLGENEFLVAENESTYIPMGEVHALENPGKVDLHLIEVQTGSYLGEDDIVRFEDKYGRAAK